MARLGIVLGVLSLALVPSTSLAQVSKAKTSELEATLAAMSRKYGVAIEAARAPGVVPGTKVGPPEHVLWWGPAPEREYLGYVSIFEGALKKYPSGLLKAAGIRKFVWCGAFDLGGLDPHLGGFYTSDDATIYLDVTVGKGAAGGRRFTIHHEVFHALDHRRDPAMEDKAWEAINGANSYYRSKVTEKGVETIFDLKPTDLGVLEPRPGFMTTYARADVREDKAELFACMMSLPIFVETRMKDERKIAEKVLRMEIFLKQSCPTIPDGFWASTRPGP